MVILMRMKYFAAGPPRDEVVLKNENDNAHRHNILECYYYFLHIYDKILYLT